MSTTVRLENGLRKLKMATVKNYILMVRVVLTVPVRVVREQIT